MRFTMDGEQFDLTADQVRARLASYEPADIKQHWVEVDGRRWPVKQVIAIATGVDKGRFVSGTARRHLRNMGFVTSGDGEQLPSISRRRKGGFDPSTLPNLDRVTVSVSFVWRDAGQITLDQRGLPTFPPLPKEPGLYRFDFGSVDGGTAHTVYIGESQELARRGGNYRNAKSDRSTQRTSRRIHTDLVRHLSRGGQVHLAISVDVFLGIDGDPVDLRAKSARRLAENAAVLLAQLDPGLTVLNIDTDLEAPSTEA
ncbi:hypothetical protein ACXC9Q_27360 [Kribbella sp. CWNU-51]